MLFELRVPLQEGSKKLIVGNWQPFNQRITPPHGPEHTIATGQGLTNFKNQLIEFYFCPLAPPPPCHRRQGQKGGQPLKILALVSSVVVTKKKKMSNHR